MKRTLINIQVPTSLRKRYKKACKTLYTNMRSPILKAINETIKEAEKGV